MGKILHAESSGYFNECVQVGVGRVGGGVFSLDHFMKMYWRAKEFKFSISGEIYINWTFPPDPVEGILEAFAYAAEQNALTLRDLLGSGSMLMKYLLLVE